MSKNDEQIWVIDRPDWVPERGLIPLSKMEDVIETLQKWNPHTTPRGPAETNPKLKQLIPYIVLHSPQHKRVFAYQRTKQAGEQRLAGKFSVGIGGHVNDRDGDDPANLQQILGVGASRELVEELGFEVAGVKSYGFINDDTTEVGKVHLGVLIEITIGHSGVNQGTHLQQMIDIVPESEMINSGWMLWEDLRRRKDEFEDWSQIVADFHA